MRLPPRLKWVNHVRRNITGVSVGELELTSLCFLKMKRQTIKTMFSFSIQPHQIYKGKSDSRIT